MYIASAKRVCPGYIKQRRMLKEVDVYAIDSEKGYYCSDVYVSKEAN